MQTYPLAFMAASRIFNGTFTIHNPHTGNHRTLRIKTQSDKANFAPGKRIISLLTGPDNTSDYKSFGFVYEEGIVVWGKYRSKNGPESDYERLAAILWSLWHERSKSPYAKFGLKLIDSCTCVYCNRQLTDTMSALTGVGPECAEKRGINRNSLPQRPSLDDLRYLDPDSKLDGGD